MAINVQLLVIWICIYTRVFAEGAGYYISTSTNTRNNVPKDCKLAQPEYVHVFAKGTINLKNSIPLNENQQHDVWIGYVKAFTEFEYHGCSKQYISISGSSNVKSLVDCNYACSGNYFGLDCSDDELQCKCLKKLPDADDLTRKSCQTLGDFVCGTKSSLAIYSVGTDKSSKNQNTISYMCKASASNSNHAAWIKCDDEKYERKVWCRNDGSSEPFLSKKTFAAWNKANEYCSNQRALPSTAVGYIDDNFEDMAFTNIFRSWTIQQGNGTISVGRMKFAYVEPFSQEIKFSAIATQSKNFLCLWPKPTCPPTTQTTKTAQATSPTTTIKSTVKPLTSPITTHSQILPTSTPNCQTSGSTHTTGQTAPTTTDTTLLDSATTPHNIQSTTSSSTTDGSSEASKQQASQGGSSTTAVSAGVSISAAIAVSVVVIVLVLRHKKNACFTKSKKSKLESRGDDNHITLPKIESKQTANYQTSGTSVSNKTYSSLQNASTCTKNADKYNPVVYTHVTCQNTNITLNKHDSEARTYFVLEKDGLEQQRSATNVIPTELHDYFVLEKQQPNKGNSSVVSTNEMHPYFVLEKEGDWPFDDRPSQEGNSYLVLEKQTNSNSPPMTTANVLELDNYDGDTYQEIDSNDIYAGIDDSREDNTDYDYTNKGFEDSRNEKSDNVYNHLNFDGDEYDHVYKGTSNFKAMENNSDITSKAVRK